MAPDIIVQVERLDGVEWALGLGPVSDVSIVGAVGEGTLGGVPTPIRRVVGEAPPLRVDVGGQSGLASTSTLRSDGRAGQLAYGTVANRSMALPLGGTFIAGAPLEALNEMLIYRDSGPIAELLVETRPGHDPEVVADVVAGMTGTPRAKLLITHSGALRAELTRTRVAMAAGSRVLAPTVAALSVALTGITGATWVMQRRRDIGRRRALGARRIDVVLLTGITFLLPSVAAVVVLVPVTVIALVIAGGAVGSTVTFAVGLGLLLAGAAAIGAAVPAALASRVDVGRVLRSP